MDTDADELVYEPIPEPTIERKLAAVLTALTRREPLATIECE